MKSVVVLVEFMYHDEMMLPHHYNNIPSIQQSVNSGTLQTLDADLRRY